MKTIARAALFGASALALAGCLCACSTTQINSALSSPPGQLFCAIQTAGGGTIVAGLVDAEATALSPALNPVAVIATGATQAQVNADCAAAAKSTGAVAAVPVSPPVTPNATPSVAVIVPKVS